METIDILNRKKFIAQLIEITENISKNKKSTSFAIDGPWGCGKSFVLKEFQKQLEPVQSSENYMDKYFVVKYNCWEYDYYEEPLVAIVATMLEAIERKTKILNGENGDKIKGVLKAVGAMFMSSLNGVVKNGIGVDIQPAVDLIRSGMNSGKDEYEKANDYDTYFSFKKTLKSLHEVLAELSEQYTVVFLIDELDRCLPEYAIKVLERLHHLIEGTNNVVNIISVDKTQLHRSVQCIFGLSRAEEYLKKFIQFTISLDVGTVSEKFIEKHADYISLFDKDIIEYEDSIEEFISAIFNKIDVREQEHLMDRIKLVHTMLFPDKKDYSFMCAELLSGVMHTYYRDKKKFCAWLENFNNILETGNNPPFANFFQNKFANMSQKIFDTFESNGVITGYEVLRTNNLYSAIAFIWVPLTLDNAALNKTVYVSEYDVRSVWESNIEELKQFVELFRIIR